MVVGDSGASSSRRGTTSRWVACASVGVLLLGLAGCGSGDGDAAVRAAEANVASKEAALADAEKAAAAARTNLCTASGAYITSIDRYGDLLTETATTVGDVRTAGSDLERPRGEVVAAAEEVESAQGDVERAQEELAQAQAALATLQGSESPQSEDESEEPAPAVSGASLERVRQAEAELAAVEAGIDDETPLAEAAQQFSAAVVALEVAWLQVFGESGCLTDERQEQALAAVAEYTTALQEALAAAGYFADEVDGVYGPATVDAIQTLQKANGLPQTGAMDKATSAALQAELAAQGGIEAQSATAATAAVQQTLLLTGYWDGPVDGEWTDELTDALMELQSDLGVEPTGTVDAATVEALEEALELLAAAASPSPSEPTVEPSASVPAEPEASVSP